MLQQQQVRTIPLLRLPCQNTDIQRECHSNYFVDHHQHLEDCDYELLTGFNIAHLTLFWSCAQALSEYKFNVWWCDLTSCDQAVLCMSVTTMVLLPSMFWWVKNSHRWMKYSLNSYSDLWWYTLSKFNLKSESYKFVGLVNFTEDYNQTYLT